MFFYISYSSQNPSLHFTFSLDRQSEKAWEVEERLANLYLITIFLADDDLRRRDTGGTKAEEQDECRARE